ncbi:NTP transferase domain-containing protein [Candidatus Kaiserbacteria bacterium]|nr:NTP transferase domain-containing protein [Candidatus Kaiserbacteria bacterium]
MKKFTCIIPSRYKSTRFDGKSLAMIHGKPMILWVAEHANKSSSISRTVVATDDKRIFDAVNEAGYEVVETPDCPNGSARVAHVAKNIDGEWVFEMQGDQPMVTPEVIDDFIERAWQMIEKNPDIDVVIPYAPATKEHTDSLDVLKVVKTENDRLVFQTRQPIQTGWRTLGLYLWKRTALLRFADLPVSDIERVEDSHPIRLYVNDFYVQGLLIEDTSWVEVDREHQIAEVEILMKEKRIV